nr:hypothetical protein [Marinicella sp. NBU2979]
MSKILANFVWIDEPDAALNLVAKLSPDSDYAVDTEFERSRTFYLNPALLQISCQGVIYLVDIAIPKVAETVLSAIQGLVLHAGSEDLELWHQVTRVKPQRVYDTQVAAALCGHALHTSYLNLVQDMMGVELDKAMSRSDWLARPLSDQQLQYAVEDIIYLDEFKTRLSETMQERGMEGLFAVLMQQLLDQLGQDSYLEKQHQKLVKSERLNHRQQQQLWGILHWRDQLAQRRNKPRNWILNPQQMIAVIKQAQQFEDLFRLGLHPKFIKLNGRSLIQAMSNQDGLNLPPLPTPVKLNKSQGVHFNAMKQRLGQVTDRLGIEPSLIVNIKDLKKLAFEGKELADLPTWQAIQ